MNSIRNIVGENRVKRSLGKYISELEGRDDFEYRQVPVLCPYCKLRNTVRFEYRFEGEDQWRIQKSPLFECNYCSVSNALETSSRANHEENVRVLKENYWLIPEDLKKKGFKTYRELNDVTTQALMDAINYYHDFLDENKHSYSLFLMGNPGTGKTHLAVAIARSLANEGFTVGFVTTGQILAKIKNTYSRGSAKSEKDIFDDLTKFDLLVIDDLGSESFSNKDLSWVKAKLFEIVNSRNGVPTVFTSNYDIENLNEAIGERIASRVNNRTKFVDLFAEDYRKKLRI